MTDPKRKRLLERTFKYVNANDTDVARTFARIRREQAKAQAVEPAAPNVKPIRKAKAA